MVAVFETWLSGEKDAIEEFIELRGTVSGLERYDEKYDYSLSMLEPLPACPRMSGARHWDVPPWPP